MSREPVYKTVMHLADGRGLIYFDSKRGTDRAAYPDTRPLGPGPAPGESRLDPLPGEWVTVAGHRQERPDHPGADVCPLRPSTTRHSEIPAPDYQVVVFENRFPSLAGPPAPDDELTGPVPNQLRCGGGRCEVVAFTGDHDAMFASLDEARPYEAHLYPKRRVPDFTALDDGQRAAFPGAHLGLLRRFRHLFGAGAPSVPCIAAWHQAPPGTVDPPGERPGVALHAEVFTIRRAPDKLKYLAGTESGMGAFMDVIPPERAAERLRAAGA